jgi:hypothetical protein
MSLKQINTRAKALRRQKPGMDWHAAQRAAAASMRGSRKRTSRAPAKTKRRVSGTAAVGSTAAVGKTRKRKKKGWFGATGVTQSRLTQIGEIAVGMGLGAVATHMVLRPLEHKVVEHFTEPLVAKAMPWAEIVLGGTMFIMAPWKLVRNIGLGVMGAGVHGAMKELPIHMHSPAESVSGINGPYTSVRIPVNGTVKEMISGLIQQQGSYVKTPTVGDSVIKNGTGPVHTPTVGARYMMLHNSPTVGGSDEEEDEDEMLYRTNLFRR